MKVTKWFIYTVFFGAIPFFARLAVWIIAPKLGAEYIINEVDMVTFGLVLNISNMNELEDRVDMKPFARSVFTGSSVFLIAMFGLFLGFAYFADLNSNDIVDKGRIKTCSASLSFLSFILSLIIYTNKLQIQDG